MFTKMLGSNQPDNIEVSMFCSEISTKKNKYARPLGRSYYCLCYIKVIYITVDQQIISTYRFDTSAHTLKSRSYMPSLVWNSDDATSMPITTCTVFST